MTPRSHPLYERAVTASRDRGPVLNIIEHPPGRCPICSCESPTAVLPGWLLWIQCEHAVTLPPLAAQERTTR